MYIFAPFSGERWLMKKLALSNEAKVIPFDRPNPLSSESYPIVLDDGLM